MMTRQKNWDAHVANAEDVARSPGFQALRDRIVEMAAPQPHEIVVDVGSGTGLLTLTLAQRAQVVWSVDIAPLMGSYLSAKASSGQMTNVETITASAVSLPLVDGFADVVVSNYCFHHVDSTGKRRALAEAYRVLRPGGRLVFGDMMFRVSMTDARDRAVVAAKVGSMVRRGPAGILRLARNGVRFAGGRWEHPARADWWERSLAQAGFIEVCVETLEHEGGIAFAKRPDG